MQVVGPWEIGALAPASTGYIFLRMQIVETLTEVDENGAPAPGLANSWKVSDDGLNWDFALRPTARFHDGSRVTAQAVVRCLEAARVAPAMLSVAPIAAIEAVDEGTVRIRLQSAYGGLPALLAHSSSIVLAPASYDDKGAVRAIIGSGPYRVETLTPPQQMQVRAFDDFDGEKPAIEQVHYLVVSRAETRALMAESGQADVVYGLDPASLARLRMRRQLRIEAVTLPRTVILKLNAGMPALKDVRVRQALSMAIDRDGIAKALLRDPELSASQLLPPSMAGWHQTGLKPLRYDPDAAAQLLGEAGWKRAGDGLRNAQGQPLQLTLRTFPDRPELPILATALQEQWRQAGIAVKVNVGNSGDIPLGHQDGSLELALTARNYASVPDPTATLLQDFGEKGGDWGAMGWSNPEVVKALDELARGNLPAERTAALRARIMQVLQEEMPVIPITWYRQQVAVSARVSGVQLDPLERSYLLTRMRWQ